MSMLHVNVTDTGHVTSQVDFFYNVLVNGCFWSDVFIFRNKISFALFCFNTTYLKVCYSKLVLNICVFSLIQ